MSADISHREEYAIPFDAICVGCREVQVRRARREEIGVSPDVDLEALEPTDCDSFKHVCYGCGSITWWNPVGVLTGQIRADLGED